MHTVDLRFNGEDVPGSPFSCQVSYFSNCRTLHDNLTYKKVPLLKIKFTLIIVIYKIY